jgi:uncharacterized protein
MPGPSGEGGHTRGTGQVGGVLRGALSARGDEVVVLSRHPHELLLKSRRVVPGRLLDAGFVFEHPQGPEAAEELVGRVRAARQQ